jgi:hypothetical protein
MYMLNGQRSKGWIFFKTQLRNKVSILTKNVVFASKFKVLVTNVSITLKISRRVNANASPDVPKPLYLIQSFG